MATSDETEKISRAPPCITERYEIATSTSNMRLDCREGTPTGAAGMLVAAGWSRSRVGMALLRLASEWDSAAKPRRPSPDLMEAMAVTIRTEDEQALLCAMNRGPQQPRPPGVPVAVRAHNRAQAWYASELRLLAVSLKSRAAVWEQLEHWRALRGIDPETVAEALLHWLDHTCQHCDGHGLRKVEGAPAHSARPCRECNGGEKYRPEGTSVVLNYLDDCVQKARTSLSNRLRDRR